jgi:hypothetical protein
VAAHSEDAEELARAIVTHKVCEIVQRLQLIVVTSFKSPVNPITIPNLVYSDVTHRSSPTKLASRAWTRSSCAPFNSSPSRISWAYQIEFSEATLVSNSDAASLCFLRRVRTANS